MFLFSNLSQINYDTDSLVMIYVQYLILLIQERQKKLERIKQHLAECDVRSETLAFDKQTKLQHRQEMVWLMGIRNRSKSKKNFTFKSFVVQRISVKYLNCPDHTVVPMSAASSTHRSNGLFTLLDLDSDSDSDLDSKPNGCIALCGSFHTAQSRIQIPILTANYRK